jgi:alanine dehydrogenase
MINIGIIKEGKIPADNRVALTPAQCKWVQETYPECKIVVQRSESRCFSDREYALSGITLKDSLEDCSVLIGIKEVPPHQVVDGKKYLFFLIPVKSNRIIKSYCRRLWLKIVRL